jgi:hypothetical protein
MRNVAAVAQPFGPTIRPSSAVHQFTTTLLPVFLVPVMSPAGASKPILAHVQHASLDT